MDIVLELFYCMRDMKKGPWITRLMETHGRKATLQVAITMLAWLRQYGDGQAKPLELDRENTLDELVRAVLSTGELSHVFELNGNSVDFAPAISLLDRRNIAGFVAANHRPEDQLIE